MSQKKDRPRKPIRVLLVDDHAILRAGLKALLETYEDIEVVGEAADGEEGIRKARELDPDVIVMDVMMPGMNGLTALRYLLEEKPDARVLMLTQYGNKEFVLPLLEAGAAGYVLKQAADTDFVKAIRAVHEGNSYLYPPIAKLVLEAFMAGEEAADPDRRLTPREREILILIAQGYTNNEIAKILYISPKTVDVHRTRLMNKLNLHNVAQIVRYAVRRRLIDPWEE
ncbi:MAG: response regulator transcription factor [Chloroflexi bacterium]|nr:response regulator transcription factor [Chloroflexota bacterium]